MKGQRYDDPLVPPISFRRKGDKRLDVLHVLFIHRMLTSALIHKLTRPEKDDDYTTKLLRQLRCRPNSYLEFPYDQRDCENARYTHLVYRISRKGAQALVDMERITPGQFELWAKVQSNYKSDHFDHDLSVGYATASIALGCRETGNRFVSWLEILDREKCPQRFASNPIAMPYNVDNGVHHIIPDDIYGVEYPNRGALFFLLEVDMATEPHRPTKTNRASTYGKFRAYSRAFAQDAYKCYGIPKPQVQTVTTSYARMTRLIRDASELEKAAASVHCFMSLPHIRKHVRDGLPNTSHIFKTPWPRADGTVLDLTAY